MQFLRFSLFRATVARLGVLLPLFAAEHVQEGEKPKEPDVDEMFKVSDVKLGKKEKVAYKTGEVRINEASPAFTTKNIGKSEIKLYVVQVK